MRRALGLVFVFVFVLVFGCEPTPRVDERDTRREPRVTTSAASVAASDDGAQPTRSPSSQPRALDGMVHVAGGALRSCVWVASDARVSEYCAPEPRQVGPFDLDRTEVSVTAFAACVTAGACSEDGLAGSGACNWPRRRERVNHPINCVAFHQAEAYCRWAGKRLPTGPEWELAARGRDARVYVWGDDPNGPASGPLGGDEPMHVALRRVLGIGMCWRAVGTCPSGAEPLANNFGVIDIAGNVAEWSSDSALDDERLRRHIGEGVRDRDWRVLYGTSWADPAVDDFYLALARARPRIADAPGDDTSGVRCAR